MDEPTCSVNDDSHSPGGLRLGMCSKHYSRWLKHGDPLMVRSRWDDVTDEDRFLAKVRKDGPVPAHRPELGPCWVWTGAKTGSGYGAFYLNGEQTGANRAAYELFVEPIPDGMEPDHLFHPNDGSCLLDKKCPHRLCPNPAHLKVVTHRENVRRSTAPAAVNMAKTRCDRGHEFTPENTYVKVLPDGRESRQCHACRRIRGEFKGDLDAPVVENRDKTHCPKGHPYDEENTYYPPNGGRMCRICRREQWQAWRDRNN